jgi:hypothetical protein
MLSYLSIESFSFPSGHALSSLCLYASGVWLIMNRLENPAIKAALWIVMAIFVLLIGLSRLYIGIHFPTDVVARMARRRDLDRGRYLNRPKVTLECCFHPVTTVAIHVNSPNANRYHLIRFAS